MAKEYKYNFQRVNHMRDITTDGVVALMNHPEGDNSYLKSTIVHLHMKDGKVRNYDIIHTSINNSTWVEDFIDMSPALIWAWLMEPNAVNFYGDAEERTVANIYT